MNVYSIYGSAESYKRRLRHDLKFQEVYKCIVELGYRHVEKEPRKNHNEFKIMINTKFVSTQKLLRKFGEGSVLF